MNKSITPLPPADFTPEMGNYKTLQPFRYWCQKVLPLVYDDSLSYYELLCKVVDYLNKTMEDVETLHGDVTNLHATYEQLQNYVNTYFSSLDVQQEINKKLDELVNSGRLDILMQNYVPYVTPQMFGAKGDGVTDDTLAFQQCFDSNKKIIVPNGNYLVGACNANNNVLLELYNRAYITLKDEYFIHTTNNINIKGGRFYGESKAPESRYYAKKVITGNLTFVNITDTHFYQCIALYQTDGMYCGFINCYNLFIYDSLFIVANKSLNYVSCVGCSFQKASNMIEATNYENISFTGCNIESVINFFSPTYADAPYNTISITESYIEYSSLFNNGRCVNIVVDKCWVYTDITLITLNKGPGSCVFSNSEVTIISDVVLTNVINCTLIIEFNVGSIKKQNTTIKADSVNLIYSGNCITKIGNQDSYYVDPTCNQIIFTGKFNGEDKCLSAEHNDLYYSTGIHGLISRTKVCLALDLGKSDLLKVTPPVGTFCIEHSSHILYAYDGTVWRKCSDGTPLE